MCSCSGNGGRIEAGGDFGSGIDGPVFGRARDPGKIVPRNADIGRGVGGDAVEVFGQDAHYGEAVAMQRERAVEHVWAAVEQGAADQCASTERGKEFRRDDGDLDLFRGSGIAK